MALVLDAGGADQEGPSTLWIELDGGIRIEVRPLTTSISEAAANVARRMAAAMTAKAEDAEKANMPLDAHGPTEANASWVQGQVLQAQIAALGRYGIVSWEGIVDRRGAPLPVNAATIDALASHPAAGPQFFNRYFATLDERVAEGNGSANSCAGNSAAAPTTAEPAPDAATEEQAAELALAS